MERGKSEPNLIRYLLAHCITGGVTGLCWAIVMLATNTAGLGTLISHSAQPVFNSAIFLAGSAISFQPIAVAVAIGCLVSDGNA
jgi:hypothetical protein